MIRIWHVIVFGVAVAIAAAAYAPAHFFFRSSPDGLAFDEATGPVWDATLTNARIGRLGAGDVRVRLSPFDVLLGRLSADLDFGGANITGKARLELGVGGERRLIVPNMRIVDFPIEEGLALTGETTISNLDLTLEDQACRTAQGVLESNALVSSADLLGVNGPNLSGVAACSGAFGRLTLSGERDGDGAELVLDLSGNGAAQWSLVYRASRPEVAARLALLGAEPQAETGAFGKRGAARWLPF